MLQHCTSEVGVAADPAVAEPRKQIHTFYTSQHDDDPDLHLLSCPRLSEPDLYIPDFSLPIHSGRRHLWNNRSHTTTKSRGRHPQNRQGAHDRPGSVIMHSTCEQSALGIRREHASEGYVAGEQPACIGGEQHVRADKTLSPAAVTDSRLCALSTLVRCLPAGSQTSGQPVNRPGDLQKHANGSESGLHERLREGGDCCVIVRRVVEDVRNAERGRAAAVVEPEAGICFRALQTCAQGY